MSDNDLPQSDAASSADTVMTKVRVLRILYLIYFPWWRHQMETFSALLAICAGNSPVTSEFPSQRPVTQSFDVFFDLRLNKRLSKQSWSWWFATPSCPLWCHCNGQFCCVDSCHVKMLLHLFVFSPHMYMSCVTSSNGNIFRVTGLLCGEFTGPGEFPVQRPVTPSFDVFFDLCLNKLLIIQWWGWWFEPPSHPLWRHCNVKMPHSHLRPIVSQ